MNNKESKYLIFVLPPSFDESNMNYSDAIEWAYSNLKHKNVCSVSLEDIYLLNERVLDIINDANDSMIGPYEDSWIDSQGVKETVKIKLLDYLSKSTNEKEKNLVSKIIELLTISIETTQNIYFKF